MYLILLETFYKKPALLSFHKKKTANLPESPKNAKKTPSEKMKNGE